MCWAMLTAVLLFAGCLARPLLGWGPPLHARPGLHAAQKSSASHKADAGSEIILTAARPIARIPVDPANLAEPSPHLAITLARITNPNHAAFSIAVSLGSQAPADDKPRGASKTFPLPPPPIVLGELGVYPSDQPGRYQLDVSSALHRLRDSGQDLTHLCLRLTLKRLHLNQPATGLEVVISAPEWTHAAQ
jgi:hypothetical protein